MVYIEFDILVIFSAFFVFSNKVAARYGRTVIVEELLSMGMETDARDKWGHTALHYAGLYGHKSTIVSLLQNGAQVSATNDMGHTPLDYVATEEVGVMYCSCFNS